MTDRSDQQSLAADIEELRQLLATLTNICDDELAQRNPELVLALKEIARDLAKLLDKWPQGEA